MTSSASKTQLRFYEAASADDAWRRIHAFFDEHLVL